MWIRHIKRTMKFCWFRVFCHWSLDQLRLYSTFSLLFIHPFSHYLFFDWIYDECISQVKCTWYIFNHALDCATMQFFWCGPISRAHTQCKSTKSIDVSGNAESCLFRSLGQNFIINNKHLKAVCDDCYFIQHHTGCIFDQPENRISLHLFNISF